MQNTYFTAFIGLGSNVGDGRKTIRQAWKRLENEGAIRLTTLSSPFFSDPVDMESDNQFTNCVGRIETSLSPVKLLRVLLGIEEEFGRDRTGADQLPRDRTLDLDLLYYSYCVVNEPDCIVPHPRIGERLFVLVPMVEIEPTYMDPVTGESVVSMCRKLYTLLREGKVAEQKIKRGTWEDDS